MTPIQKHLSVMLSLLVSVISVARALSAASSKHATISWEQARQLVYKAAENQAATTLPKFGLDSYRDPDFPDFYFFEATWDNPQGSVVIGHYAVDSRTGDVWDGVVCREIQTRSLRRLQQQIRKSMGIDEKGYQRLRRTGPMCSPGEPPLTSKDKGRY